MLFRNVALFLSATTTMVLAQDQNPAFLSTCGPKTYALTFDDGPESFTPELLGYLKEANVKATFFVLGVQLAKPGLRAHTKAAFDAGHMIASHSQDHADFNSLTAEQIKLQLSQSNAEIKQTIGVETNYFRAPFGNCSAVCAAVLKEMSYTNVIWNMDSNDWRVVRTPQEEDAFKAFTTDLLSPTISTIGRISLQHDIHGFSVKMVPRIIKALTDAGFTFVTVDKCAPNLPTPYRGATPATPGATPAAPGATPAAPGATPATAPGAGATTAPGSAKPVSVKSSAEKSSASVSVMVGSVLGAMLVAAL